MSTGEDPAPRATPLAFALGSLTERVANLANEQALSRAASEALPDRLLLIMTPRLVALEVTDKDHEARITALEKWRWLVVGGSVVIIAGIGVVVGHPIH